jgi:hypothetical protein
MIIPSFFGENATSPSIQALVDNTLDTLQVKSLWRQFLDVDLPQASLSFEQVIGRARIEAAGSIVDIDAPAPMRGNNTIEKYFGAIPSIKEKFVMKQSELRDLMALEESQLLGGNASVRALITKLYDHVSVAAVAGDKRVDILLLQAMSTLAMDVSVTNNPDGAALGTIDLLPKAYQKQGVPVVWTDAANAKPVDDIDNFIEYISTNFGRGFGRLVMSRSLWRTFRATAQVQSRLVSFFNIGKQAATYAPTLQAVNEMFDQNGWPPIVLINDVIGVEKDGNISSFKFFDANNVSFLPDGMIGTLKNAVPMERIKPIQTKAYADFGPTLISKWGEDDPYREYTAMEMNACPALNTDAIFLLKTTTVQSSFNSTP